MVTKHQYGVDTHSDGRVKENAKVLNKSIDSEMCIKLLTRCLRLFDAKASISRILKMAIEKEKLSEKLRTQDYMSEDEELKQIKLIKRFSTRLCQQIEALQNEHKILKRPFVLHGKDYLTHLKAEMKLYDEGHPETADFSRV